MIYETPAFWIMMFALMYVVMGVANLRDWLIHLEDEVGQDASNVYEIGSIFLAGLVIVLFWMPITFWSYVKHIIELWKSLDDE